MKTGVLVCLIGLIMGLFNPALAAQVCEKEARHFCANTLRGGTPFTIAACLAAHKSSLSAACRKRLGSYGS